jgi:NHL repeat-containing protein
MPRGTKIVGVVGFVVGMVLGTAAPAGAASGAGAEPLPPIESVRRVAGIGQPPWGGYSGDGQAAVDARLGQRLRIDVAADGSLLIADPDNRRIRRVDTNGVIDTVPAPAGERGRGPWFEHRSPSDLVAAPDGSMYLADGRGVDRLGRNGSWTVLGGGGEASFSDGGDGGDGGPATRAFLYDVYALDLDAAGRIYVPDGFQQRVRRIDRDGTIHTIAGGGTVAPSAKPIPARSARMYPTDIEVDPAGGYWVVSRKRLGTDTAHLLHVDAHGMLTAVPLDPRPAGIDLPIALGPDGTLYAGYGNVVRKVADDGTTTLAGGPFASGLSGLAIAADGTVYGAGEGVVERMVAPDPREGKRQPTVRPGADPWADEDAGTVHRVLGDGRFRDDSASHDPEQARRPQPRDVAPGKDGDVYVLDGANSRVLHVAADGRATVLTKLGGEDEPISCVGLTTGPDGDLYTVDVVGRRVLRVTTDGHVSDVDGPAVSDEYRPASLAVDRAGRFYLPGGTDYELVRYAADGKATPFAGGGDRDGAKADGGPARAASMYGPQAAAIAPDGSVALLEEDMHAVRVVRPNGTLVTVAGNADNRYEQAGFSGDRHPAKAALLDNPQGVAFGPDGTLYIADTFNNRVRRVGRDGVITTIAGTGQRAENGDGGPATRAALLEPEHLAVTTDGALWVSGSTTTRLRRIAPDGTISTPTDVASTAGRRPETLITGDGLAVDPHGTVYVGASDQSILSARPGRRARLFAQRGNLVNTIAAAADGSVYVGGDPLWHRYANGARTAVLGALGALGDPTDGADARTVVVIIRDSAVAPDGTLYLASRQVVYALVGGRLRVRWRMPGATDTDGINGIAAGPDGTLYAATAGHEVVAVRGGKARRVAGNGQDSATDDDRGDGGPATEAVVFDPNDVAVGSDGTLYASTIHGIRRVSPDGDIDTIVAGSERSDGSSTYYTPPTSLAVDAHDNLYYAQPDLNQVVVVVHANEMSGLDGGTSPWWWLGGAALVVAAAAVYLWRRRATRSATEPVTAEPAAESPESTESTESTEPTESTESTEPETDGS